MKNHKKKHFARLRARVQVLNTSHSGLAIGQIGRISSIEKEKGGYGVDFDEVTGLSSAGASVKGPATVFMPFGSVGKAPRAKKKASSI